jgi:hypothetical protein
MTTQKDRPPMMNPASRVRRMLMLRLSVYAILPAVAFPFLRPHVPSDTVALAILGSIPACVTSWWFVWRRRLDPIGLLAVMGFGIALLLSLVWPNKGLLLKLHESALTASIGLTFLVSAGFGKPLHAIVRQRLRRGAPSEKHPRDLSRDRSRSIVISAIIGAIFLIHAAVHNILAITLRTETFLVVSRIIGLCIFAAGAAVLIRYVRRQEESP